MIKNFVLFFLVLVASSVVRAAPRAPTFSFDNEAGLTARVFNNYDDFSLMAEAALFGESDSRNFKAVTLGGYFQAADHLKVGAFYRRAFGLRHDDDWISTSGNWHWSDSTNRAEDFVILDATPRTLVTDELVAEIKTRDLYNVFNKENTLLLRPGLTYFLLKDGQPFWNFFAQFEMDFPLNYGQTKTSEEWIYLGALRSLTKNIDIGAFAAEKWQRWGSSSTYLAKGGAPYLDTDQTSVISALLIYQY
jgi:hypothetical protein